MSWNDDPFGQTSESSDRTIVRPTPRAGSGRKTTPEQKNVPPKPRANYVNVEAQQQQIYRQKPQPCSLYSAQLRGVGNSHLINAASPVLLLIYKLRTTVTQDNVMALQDHVGNLIRQFEEHAKKSACEKNIVLTARYLLCTSIDESVIKTPWGIESHWASNSLLSRFHNENFGGEKFFQIIDLLLQNAHKNIELIKLAYLCITFGFEGKYAVDPRGSTALADIRNRLFDIISIESEDCKKELSPNWHGVSDGRNALVKFVPLWVVAVVAGVLLLLVYTGYSLVLRSTSYPVYEEYESIVKQPLVNREYKSN